MADTNSITFWSQVAGSYKNDGRVLFELYNEPHDVRWDVWKSGGMTSGGWTAAGMQQLYDAVRATGAENLVVIGGLDCAYDLSGVPRTASPATTSSTRPTPTAAAPTRGPRPGTRLRLPHGDRSGDHDRVRRRRASAAAETYTPAINTYVSPLITYADSTRPTGPPGPGTPAGASFPSLISDWKGTPTPPGMLVQAALAGYGEPSPGGKRHGGSGRRRRWARGHGGATADGGRGRARRRGRAGRGRCRRRQPRRARPGGVRPERGLGPTRVRAGGGAGDAAARGCCSPA